jgi:hypothetical protein
MKGKICVLLGLKTAFMIGVGPQNDNLLITKNLLSKKEREPLPKKRRLLPLQGSRRRCLPYADSDNSIPLHAIVQRKKDTIRQVNGTAV